MDLVALQIFKAVVEQGGINKAAAKLHRVPSSVTTRIRQLEEHLGAKLFVREGRKLSISQEGKTLLTYANQLLRISSEAEVALRNGKPRGALRLGALESTSATRLPPILARYHFTYPDVRIELTTGTSGALVSLLHSQNVEAALIAEPFNAVGLEGQTAFIEELVLITPKSFPRIRSPRDIGGRTVIAFAAGCSYRRRLEAWLGSAKVLPDRVMEFQSYHAIVACVAAGSGVAVVPRSVMNISPGGREVAVTSLPKDVSKARTQLVWRSNYHSVALEALKKLIGVRPHKMAV